jgi:uncharacterized coiled-coil protein SlyX
MTAAEMYRILDEIDKRLDKQDKIISALQDQIRDVYNRLRK